jgi:hypothetical protein
MKLNTAKHLLSVVVLLTIISLAAPTTAHAKKKQSDDDETSQSDTNNPTADKPGKARRYQDQNPSVSPNVPPTTGHVRKKQADDNETSLSSTNQPATDKPGKVRRYQDQNPAVSPNVAPDSIQPHRQSAVEDSRGVDRSRPGAGLKKQEAPADAGNVSKPPATPAPRLETRPTRNGIEKTTPSGVVRERVEKRHDGEHTEQFTATGRKQREEIAKTDGTVEKKYYNPGGKVNREEVVRTDGSREVSNHQLGRDGKLRAKETIVYDSHQTAVSKTVTKNITINKTVNKTVVVNHYDRGAYGFVYRPVYARPAIFVSWYDPYWYSPAGVVVYHPFHYAWGWESYGWYRSYHGPYWATYDVYPAPSYWVTDYMVAGYLSDHYEAQISADQAREEARLAREDADRAQRLAQEAKDEAEIAEARTAQLEAELRAKNAEDKLARVERDAAIAGKPNPNATPIDKDTKEAFKSQIERTIAEKKDYAEQADKGGNPPLPDVSRALADPAHIYPVSKVISVTAAKDSNPAGTLSEGDLLKLEPVQDIALKDATENTLLKMRVMTSKGEDGEVAAGTVVNVSVKDLQDFDNEFRAKLDVALTEADKNKDAFKQGAVAK